MTWFRIIIVCLLAQIVLLECRILTGLGRAHTENQKTVCLMLEIEHEMAMIRFRNANLIAQVTSLNIKAGVPGMVVTSTWPTNVPVWQPWDMRVPKPIARTNNLDLGRNER